MIGNGMGMFQIVANNGVDEGNKKCKLKFDFVRFYRVGWVV